MRIVTVILACAVIGCAPSRSPSGGGDDDDASVPDPDAGPSHVEGTLSVDPPTKEVTVKNGVPEVVAFTATLTKPDGSTEDVTARTRFQVASACCTFSGSRLTVYGAVRTKLTAAYADKGAFVDLTARYVSERTDSGLPSNTPRLFDHPETDVAALAPAIVYPANNVVMPRNLGDFEVHWTDSNALDTFEVSLHTELADVKVYTAGTPGVTGTHPLWTELQAREWGVAVGDANQVTVRVRGLKASAPTQVGGGPARIARLSNEVMDGGLYYWANVDDTGGPLGIFRHDMKKPGEPAERFVTTTETAGRCVACHVLSRDGTKMAITYQDENNGVLVPPGPAAMVDVQSKAIASQSQRWQFATFTPDNKQLLSVDNGVLVVRDTVDQHVITTMTISAANERVTQPDLSKDGKHLLYVRYVAPDTDFEFSNGKIYTRSYDPDTHAFGAEAQLIMMGGNNFYPSWSPDGQWVLFNHIAAGSAYDNNNAAPWVARADGTQPVALTAASATLATDSWPRWAPFGQTLGDAKEPMFWLTWSSKRDFGVRLLNAGKPQRGATGRRAQIWMSPFFPAKAALGQDPSAPAFRLPFQTLTSSNHIAQWTERVVIVIE
jgi:hypothetical protein